MVSRQYLANITGRPQLRVVASADTYRKNATDLAAEFDIKAVSDADELVANPGIDLVLNLTTPAAHHAITRAALKSGKHVYSEKPISTDIDEARNLVALASYRGLQFGGALDTFMGPGVNVCAALIESGAIGLPLAANAFMMDRGPERFHPGPEFLYRKGAGPLLDIGPYYLSAMVTLLGAVTRVSGMAVTP